MPITPASPVHSIEDLGDRLKIAIPARKQWLGMLFLLFWLTWWTFAGKSAWSGFLNNGSTFLLLWLAGWCVGEAAAGYSLVWMLTGREIIEVSSQSIITRFQILGLSVPREYLAERIQNMRVAAAVPQEDDGATIGPSIGVLAFDYGARTVRIAGGIDEAEGRQLFDTFTRRFPQYRPRAELA
jgi:hypothetical protein